MRRWLPRSLWLLAWSLWAWLGWGLYRELPRDCGPAIAKLPLSTATGIPLILGFIGDTDQVVAINLADDHRHSTIDMYDARGGSVVRSMQGPADGRYLSFNAVDDQVFARLPPGSASRNESTGIYALSLTTGNWRKLSTHNPGMVSFHPSKGWMAFIDRPPGKTSGGRVVIFDYRRCQEVFVLPDRPSRTPDGVDQVSVDGQRLLVPVRKDDTSPGLDLEVWRLEEPPILERVVPGAVTFFVPFPNVGNLIAFPERPHGAAVDVYDIATGEYVFSYPPREERVGGSDRDRPAYEPTLGSNGRTLLAGAPATLWDFRRGDVLWRGGDGAVGVPLDGNRFAVEEHWGGLLGGWLPGTNYATTAFRSMADGRLMVRFRNESGYAPTTWNSAGTIGIAMDGSVFRLPPRVNYPLLANCQAILALPLVLLWATLRWRRKRRLRLAGAAS